MINPFFWTKKIFFVQKSAIGAIRLEKLRKAQFWRLLDQRNFRNFISLSCIFIQKNVFQNHFPRSTTASLTFGSLDFNRLSPGQRMIGIVHFYSTRKKRNIENKRLVEVDVQMFLWKYLFWRPEKLWSVGKRYFFLQPYLRPFWFIRVLGNR